MENELVIRIAPRWAWEVIDETLEMDANSKAFDRHLRQEITAALTAMILACERDNDEPITMDEALKHA